MHAEQQRVLQSSLKYSHSGKRGAGIAQRAGSRRGGTSKAGKQHKVVALGLFGGHAAATKVAEAAKAAAAAAKLEATLKMPLWQHSVRCLFVCGSLIWGSAYLSHLLHKQADKAQAKEEAAIQKGHPIIEREPSLTRMAINASMHAVERPLATILPVFAWTQTVRAIATLLDVCALHGQKNKLPAAVNVLVNNTHLAMRTIQQVIVGFSEVAAIILAVWVMIRLKERLVKVFVETEQTVQGEQNPNQRTQDRALERIVVPLSGLASWMAVLSGVLMSLHVLGINIQPLLTVGGVSGVIVGLSAQSVVSNMISGVNLFLSRPFVVGERIDISHSSGAKFLTGFVERVDPMRTILRTDTCMPVMIPNKVLADMIITNESRIQKTYVVSNFRKPRQYLASISVRHSDMKAVGPITVAMQNWLRDSPGIDHGLPFFVGLASLDNQACNLTVLLHTTAQKTREFGTFRQEILLAFGKIVQEHGAKLALPAQVVHVSAGKMDKIINGGSNQATAQSNGNVGSQTPDFMDEVATA